jgi:hypothetical protein
VLVAAEEMTANTTPLMSILITLAGPPPAQAQPWCQPPWCYQQPQQQPLPPGSPPSQPQHRPRPKVHQERHWQDMSPEQARNWLKAQIIAFCRRYPNDIGCVPPDPPPKEPE